ncbi:MAG: glycosyltransferase family 2 protein, partial [Flexibacteraceae bacterium]
MPTPIVAFFKIFGFTAFFPKSKLFARYYLGHLPSNETNAIEILSGAFMLMRKEALDKAGLLDETFFMYGEDIDLSYRILKAGYDNQYYAGTTIIHYKGESTKRGSLNYVRVFYQAMVIFAQKHFSSSYAGLLQSVIQFAIYLRAALAVGSRIAKNIFPALLDGSLIFGGMYILKVYWEN